MTDITTAQASDTPRAPDRDRDERADGSGALWAAVILLLAAWAGSIALLGVPGIFLPALVLVPVVFALILAITWG